MIWVSRLLVAMWMTATVAIVLVAIVSCARSGMRHKGRYIFLSMVGVFRLYLHWSSGTVAVDWLVFTLLGISINLAEQGVTLGVSLPAGALLTLERLRRETPRTDGQGK